MHGLRACQGGDRDWSSLAASALGFGEGRLHPAFQAKATTFESLERASFKFLIDREVDKTITSHPIDDR